MAETGTKRIRRSDAEAGAGGSQAPPGQPPQSVQKDLDDLHAQREKINELLDNIFAQEGKRKASVEGNKLLTAASHLNIALREKIRAITALMKFKHDWTDGKTVDVRGQLNVTIGACKKVVEELNNPQGKGMEVEAQSGAGASSSSSSAVGGHSLAQCTLEQCTHQLEHCLSRLSEFSMKWRKEKEEADKDKGKEKGKGKEK